MKDTLQVIRFTANKKLSEQAYTNICNILAIEGIYCSELKIEKANTDEQER